MATGMDIKGMETGMVTGIGGPWRRAWRQAAMDDDGHVTGMHEGVDGDGHQRTQNVASRDSLR